MRHSRSHRLVVAAVLAIASVVATAGAVLADGLVRIQPDRFMPAEVTVAPGAKVTWRNDLPSGTHTATADDSAFDTGPIGPGEEGTITFLMAGRFGYSCQVLPSMKGTVVVADAIATPAPTPVKPPPTDLVSDLTRAGNGTPLLPILGLLVSIGGLGVLAVRSLMGRRAASRRWRTVGPGDAPRRSGGYAHADQWTSDDRPRG